MMLILVDPWWECVQRRDVVLIRIVSSKPLGSETVDLTNVWRQAIGPFRMSWNQVVFRTQKEFCLGIGSLGGFAGAGLQFSPFKSGLLPQPTLSCLPRFPGLCTRIFRAAVVYIRIY